MIIGNGFIGKALSEILYSPILTRKDLDLLNFTKEQLPEAKQVFLCAGVNGAKACEGSSDAYKVNVDATIKIAKHYSSKGSFLVWISSTMVEWSDCAYARQKALSEIALLTMPNVAVVRAGRVLKENVNDLCLTMYRIADTKSEGLHLWGEETAYKR